MERKRKRVEKNEQDGGEGSRALKRTKSGDELFSNMLAECVDLVEIKWSTYWRKSERKEEKEGWKEEEEQLFLSCLLE